MRRDPVKVIAFIVLILGAVVIFTSVSKGDGYKYDPHGKRDPFVPLLGIDRPMALKLEDVTSAADIRLEGIAAGAGGRQIAILNGEIVREGDKFGDIEIKKISGKAVTISMGGKNHEKELSEEGGSKNGR